MRCSVTKVSFISGVCAGVVILCRLGSYIFSPLWLDSLNSTVNFNINESGNATTSCRDTSPFFLVFAQVTFPVIFWGVILGFKYIFNSTSITYVEKSYSKKTLMLPGFTQALSAMLINYAMSGSRTAPYLQAILGNFSIPIQFITRFIILRKRPTTRKLICAVVVMIAEIICLLPSIFPSLESNKAHTEDGGASGVGAILWPLFFVSSAVPYTIANVLMEHSVQSKESETQSDEHLNIVFYIFWYSLALLIGTLSLFWLDLLPFYGTSENISVFWDKFIFNLGCLFGQYGCGSEILAFAWIVILVNGVAFFTIALFLRYSEGSSYMLVVLALRTPILFLFWTLFNEHPFYWHPHFNLSTILSIIAVCVMMPAIIIYNTGAPETTVSSKKTEDIVEPSESDPLLPQDGTIQ